MPDNDADLPLALEMERLGCMHDYNIARLDELLHPRFRFTHLNGLSEGKAAFLDRLSQKKVFYHPFQLDDVSREQFGDCIILNGCMCGKIDLLESGDEVALNNRFSSVWIKDGNTWRAASYQSTPLDP